MGLACNRFLRFCCLVVLAFAIVVGQGVWPLPGAATLHASDAAALVRQGVAAYQNYQFAAAIDYWEQALAAYPEETSTFERATILENLARAHQQRGQLPLALQRWQQSTALYKSLGDRLYTGQALTAQAQIYNRLGQPLQAMKLLCGPVTQQEDAVKEVHFLDCTAESAVAITQQAGSLAAQVSALGTLGETYRATRAYGAAVATLQAGIDLARGLESNYLPVLLQNSLGNAYRAQAERRYRQAAASLRSASGNEAELYALGQQAEARALQQLTASLAEAQGAGFSTLEVRALLSLINLYSYTDSPAAMPLFDQAVGRLATLPQTEETAFLALQLAKRQRPLLHPNDGHLSADDISIADFHQSSRSQCLDVRPGETPRVLLEQALAIARSLEHSRLSTFAQGELGHFYECRQDYPTALAWTQQARLAASGDRHLALDTLYLWQWQTGRIHRRLGQLASAKGFYKQATDNLNRIREEILATNQSLQFEFRDAVAPVYRELAELQLIAAAEAATEAMATKSVSQPGLHAVSIPVPDLSDVLGNIDDLQLAELQNYFGSDCIVPVADRRLDQLLSTPADASGSLVASTALINTILFPDRTAVILTLPRQSPRLHWIPWPEPQLRETIISFRNGLEDLANDLDPYDKTQAQALYQAIIAPFEDTLKDSGVKTLIFVHDGILRNVPMAALHDGEAYLAERYAVVAAPSLQQSSPAGADPSDFRALVLGLTENPTVNGVALGALPAVGREVQEVVESLPGSELLLDDRLTYTNLEQTLQEASYPVVHIATHGRFGTDPQSTFLVLGDKEPTETASSALENKRLSLGELDALIRRGGERESLLSLIVLSACQTASGDERSSLGLAGVTIRAGAQSAIASLWSVSDDATATLMAAFYQGWTGGLSKAEALRRAQQQLREDSRYAHPGYWSAFILVGDWA